MVWISTIAQISMNLKVVKTPYTYKIARVLLKRSRIDCGTFLGSILNIHGIRQAHIQHNF